MIFKTTLFFVEVFLQHTQYMEFQAQSMLPTIYFSNFVVPSVSVVPCTIGKYVQNHSAYSVSSNTFRQISPLFGGVSGGCLRMRIAALFVHWVIRCLEMFFLYFVNTFINSFVVINAALIWYFSFENAACQVVGTHWKYFLVGGKGSSTKESIHDGRTWERKWNSLHYCGRQGTRWGKEIEEFWLDVGCQYIE